MGRADNLDSHNLKKNSEPLFAQLHRKLRNLDGSNSTEQLETRVIRAKIQAHLPTADTAGAIPQRKTPKGNTRVLHMNYMQSQTETSVQTEFEHLCFFASTAQLLGLRLEILTDEACQEEITQELAKEKYLGLNYAIAINKNPVSKWAEDSVEYLANGQVAVLYPMDDDLLHWAMTTGRRERWQGKIGAEALEAALRNDHSWILLGTGVNSLRMGAEREWVARTQGRSVGHIRAYIEGGNMIAGEDAAGQPVLLVGKDAIAATANLYQLSNDQVRQVICEDFGLDTLAQVICVEQPGKFHLDMAMLFIGDGIVVLNDSSAALKDAVEMAELVPCLTTEQKAVKLQLQCALEKDAESDLRSAGLEVRRENLESDVFYNFFNGEFVTGADGLTYYITNGGLKEQEERFENLMIKEWSIAKKVFFSPQKAAQKSLQDRGGVGCRLKGAPA